MHGFTEKDEVARGPGLVIWRHGELVYIHVFGTVDDAASDRWRTATQREFSHHGYPRFVVVDFRKSEPQNSMASRFRTAAFARASMQRISFGVIATGSRAAPTVVVRAVLRAVGLPNLELCTDDAALDEMVAAMLRGERPYRTGAPSSPPRA